MQWPNINRHPLKTVTVPILSGGLNLRDNKTLINDNQLTACENMWYKDGTLKTRPGIYTNENMKISIPSVDVDVRGSKPLDIFMTKGGKLYRLYQMELRNTTYLDATLLAWMSESDTIDLPPFYGANLGVLSFVVEYDSKLYAFTQNKKVYTMEINPSSNTYNWTELREEDMHVPTIITNCLSDGVKAAGGVAGLQSRGATMVDGYNLLSSRYKMIYSTVNPDILDEETTSHKMVYTLLHTPPKDSTVTVKVTTLSGAVYNHSVTISDTYSENGWYIEPSAQGSLRIKVKGKLLYFIGSNNLAASISIEDYLQNNMEVIASYKPAVRDLNKIFGMREAVWFGSDALGLSGGTRLFLCGNTYDKDKSLVLWSGLNEPTYFPENCYAYVGDNTQKVNAFGRQNDSLIILKDREIFYTRYARNDDITAQDLMNQSVVDYTASSVYFPMIQLHSSIGCNLPNTVQLCRNRLVWANSDGNVYTLVNQNQYSERNVYCVSDMIHKDLKNNGIGGASSADFDGHYFLFAGGYAYVMNYESYGFVSPGSYHKDDDAQLMIPWWEWKLPTDGNTLCCSTFVVDNKLFCAFLSKNPNDDQTHLSNYLYPCIFDYSKIKDTVIVVDESSGAAIYIEKPINSKLTTKIFDFEAPHNIKNIPLVNINFGENGRTPVNVSFVSECGTDNMGTVNIAKEIHNKRFRPYSKFVSRFGICLECKGKMSIDSISLNYRILGGAD